MPTDAVPHDYDGTGFPDAEDAAAFAAVPDAFQRLWTPYRIAYVQSDAQQKLEAGCPFCVAPSLSDEEALIVHRGEHAYVLLNLYPYNSGHLLVCPYRHVAGYNDATLDEVTEIATLTQSAMRVLTATSGAHGYNIGMNQGPVAGAGVADHLHQHVAGYNDATHDEVNEIAALTQSAMRVLTATSGAHGYNIGMNQGPIAGAGVADHLHQHIVPRWAHDANFFPIIAGTKALPRLLGEVREEIANAWHLHA